MSLPGFSEYHGEELIIPAIWYVFMIAGTINLIYRIGRWILDKKRQV